MRKAAALEITQLSRDEKLELLDRLWKSLGQDPEALPLTSSQREELDRRLDELEDEGPTGLSWDEVVTQARAHSSIVSPALRISARRVPTDSSLCYGTDRLALTPDLTSTKAADLTDGCPAGPLESLGCLFSGDIAEFPHELDGHDNRDSSLVFGERCHSFLVFRPQPSGNRLSNILQRLLLVLAL